MPRIIAGKFKYLKIPTITGGTCRPSTSRVREAIFNLLQSVDFAGKNVLDLFCGSGSLGIEAMSRGAAHASFVDNNPGQIALLGKFLSQMPHIPSMDTFCQDARKPIRSSKKYDLVFIDPPYHQDLIYATLENLQNNQTISNRCLTIIESSHGEDIKLPASYQQVDQRKYGKTQIIILRNE